MNQSKIQQWLEEEAKTPPPIETQPLRKSYEQKIVAWLDILGIRNKIKNETEYDAEDIFTIMRRLSVFVQKSCDELRKNSKLSYIQIADGFMIVADLDCAERICQILSEIQWKILIELKMLSRGAITVGNVGIFEDESLIIGPAYVEAYALESENAIFPRVILSEPFISVLEKSDGFQCYREDMDKMNYLDFVDFILKEERVTAKRLKSILITNGVMAEISKSYHAQSDNSNLSIVQKYGWIISLFKLNNISII